MLHCSANSPNASAYVPYFAHPCPNALTAEPALCEPLHAHDRNAGDPNHVNPNAGLAEEDGWIERLDPPVRGRGASGVGMGGWVDVHGREGRFPSRMLTYADVC